MKGQSKWGYFGQLSWDDRATVTNFNSEFTHTSSTDVLYLSVSFEINGAMIIIGGGGPKILNGAWDNFPKYQTNYNTQLPPDILPFTWNQLLAYWEEATGDMIPDVYFGGKAYTLRCPTTTHLREAIMRGPNGSLDDIADWPCLIPWFGCYNGAS
jgi:hypothetical protein